MIKNKNWLVISRYNEDLKWVKSIINNKKIDKIIIFNKGDNNYPEYNSNKIKIINKNNIGREGESYLNFIIENYSYLPDNIWFSQADPFEHSPDFLKLLKENTIQEYIKKEIQSLTIRWKPNTNIPPDYYLRNNNFYNLKNCKCIEYFIDSKTFQLKGHSSYFDSLFQVNYYNFIQKYNSEDIGKKLSEIIGIDPPNNIIKYIWSACFFVKKENILRHPISVYIKLRNFLLESNNQGGFQGYILERFWPFLFTGYSYETITDCYMEDFIDNNGILSFDNRNKNQCKKTFNKYSKIYEDTHSILIIKKNNKILSIPGLNINNKNDNIKENKICIILSGNVRDSLNNLDLNNFLKFIHKKFNDLDLYINIFQNIQKNNGNKWYYSKKNYNKEQIRKYFEIKIKNIFFLKPNNLDTISNFLYVRENIKKIIPNYNKIIDLRIDIFCDYDKQINNLNLDLEEIVFKIDNSKKNFYTLNNLEFEDFIVADSILYKNFLSELKKNENYIKEKNFTRQETSEYICNLVKDL